MTFIFLLVVKAAFAAGLFEHSQLPTPAGKINHGQATIELASGEVMDCWYSGTSEAGWDSVILCSTSPDKGLHWSAPQTVVQAKEKALGAKAQNKSVGNVTLSIDSQGRLWLIYGVIQRTNLLCTNWKCGRVDGKFSTDGGRTWSAGVRIDDRNGALTRAQPQWIKGLGNLIPVYLENDRASSVLLTNLGALNDQTVPHPIVLPIPMKSGDALIQPTLIQRSPTQVVALLRDANSKSVYFSSLDLIQKTWSVAVPTNLPNPNAAIDAKRMDNGDIVIVYNPSTSLRNSLRLARSNDGRTFQPGCELVPANTEGDVAYPTMIRATDGTWHITYSSQGKQKVEHVHFDEAWLNSCLANP